VSWRQTSERNSPAVSGDDLAVADVFSFKVRLFQRDGVQDDGVVQKCSVFVALSHAAYVVHFVK